LTDSGDRRGVQVAPDHLPLDGNRRRPCEGQDDFTEPERWTARDPVRSRVDDVLTFGVRRRRNPCAGMRVGQRIDRERAGAAEKLQRDRERIGRRHRIVDDAVGDLAVVDG